MDKIMARWNQTTLDTPILTAEETRMREKLLQPLSNFFGKKPQGDDKTVLRAWSDRLGRYNDTTLEWLVSECEITFRTFPALSDVLPLIKKCPFSTIDVNLSKRANELKDCLGAATKWYDEVAAKGMIISHEFNHYLNGWARKYKLNLSEVYNADKPYYQEIRVYRNTFAFKLMAFHMRDNMQYFDKHLENHDSKWVRMLAGKEDCSHLTANDAVSFLADKLKVNWVK